METGGKEQPHIHRAIKEIDRALAMKLGIVTTL